MIDVVQDENEKWHFRIKSGNGEVMVQSKAYSRSFDAQRGAQRMSEIMFKEEAVKVAALKEAAATARAFIDQNVPNSPKKKLMLIELDGALKL